MHALVFVIGDQVREQLRPQLREHIDFYVVGGRWSGILPKRKGDGTIENVDSLRAGEIASEEALLEVEQSARRDRLRSVPPNTLVTAVDCHM